MDEMEAVIGLILALLIGMAVGGIVKNSFPTTIEGRVVMVTYSMTPPWHYTNIQFTSLGGWPVIVTLGGNVEVKTGVTYRITYTTPIGYFYAEVISLEEIK